MAVLRRGMYEPLDPNAQPDAVGYEPVAPPVAQPSAPPDASTQPTTPAPTPSSGPYAQVPGYDYSKLSDPTHRGDGKYNTDVGLFSQGLAATNAQPGEAGMKTLSDWLNAHGGANTYSGDQLTFADYGQPIDVMTNYNPTGAGTSWSFQDPRGRAPALPAAPGGNPFAGGSLPTLPNSGLDASTLSSMLDLGKIFGGPSTGGVFGDSNLQQVGQDPFSQLITGGLTNLITDQTSRLHSTPQQQAIAMEAARSPYEAARKVQLNNATAALADRGTLGEPGQPSGLLSDAVGRIETNLAPAYTGAIADEFGKLNDREATAANTLTSALASGTNRQSALSDIAIRTLEQSRIFDQFLAQYGLDKVKVLNDIANGQNDQYLKLLELYLQQAQIAGNGFI